MTDFQKELRRRLIEADRHTLLIEFITHSLLSVCKDETIVRLALDEGWENCGMQAIENSEGEHG